MINTPPSPPDEPMSSQSPVDDAMSNAVQKSAQQIWLAGMGAFAKAQEEGGRVFEALVREGLALQRKTHAAAEERIVEASGKIGDIAGKVTSQAGQQWDRLESIFEERVAKSLNRLGMPSVKDVRALVDRVEALNVQVATLTQRLADRNEIAAPAAGTAAAAGPSESDPAPTDSTAAPIPAASRRGRQRSA